MLHALSDLSFFPLSIVEEGSLLSVLQINPSINQHQVIADIRIVSEKGRKHLLVNTC